MEQRRSARAHAPLVLSVMFVFATGALLWRVNAGLAQPVLRPYAAAVVLGCYILAVDPRAELRFELRRHAFCISLADVPLVIGVFLLPTWAVVGAATLAWVVAWLRNRGPVKRTVFNASVTALSIAIAGVIFWTLPTTGIAQPGSWLAAFLAALVASAIGALAVLLVITLVQGNPGWDAGFSLVWTTLVSSILNVAFALIVLLVVHTQVWAGLLVVALSGVLVLAYVGYSRSVRERKSLAELYEFTRAVGSAEERDRDEGGLADVVLEKTREFLRAESATLWLPDRDGFPGLLMVASVDGQVKVLPADEADATRVRVIAERRTLVRSEDSHFRAADESELSTAVVTPLYAGDSPVGVLEVRERLGENARFNAEDAQLLQALAAHAGVAVQNSRLVHQLRHDASHDALTGLVNRRYFFTLVEQALAAEFGLGEVVAVLLLDLDSFKDVNDTLGHSAGDRLLVEVGARLSHAAPAGAVVARMGGDEFAVLLRLQGAGSAHEHGVALQEALHAPVALDGMFVDAGGSVGIAVYPEHAQDAVTLLQRAEVAMYAAKDALRPVQSYLPTMDSLSVRRLALVSELRRAIEDQQLAVYYQPKVQLADQELVGVEALVRWEHPEQGVISPDDFIPIAEHTGMIGPLTAYVLESALRQCRAWQDDGRRLHVAVNISVRSLLDADFPDQVARLLAECGVSPGLLTLEITESGVMSDVDRAMPTLERLKALGIRLAVDDFGTGQSSLTYLRRLPVSEVKIDKTFIFNMATDTGDAAVVQTIVDLGRNLGLRVVAEGVESEISYSLLREMGCDQVQGYLLSRPLPYERLEAWIKARTEMTPTLTGVRRLRVVNG